MKNILFVLLLLLLVVFIFSGCISGNSKGESLILNNLSDQEKSELLSNKGVQLYKTMTEKDDLELIPEIINNLSESLKLNPKNGEAAIYLQKTKNYSRDTIASKIKIVKNNLVKTKGRTDGDNYNLCLTLHKAYKIDPDNKEVITLRDKTKDIREKLAQDILSYGDTQRKLTDKIANKIIQGNTIVPIIEKFDRALLLGSSQEKNLAVKRSDFVYILTVDMDSIISETKKLIEKNKYHDVEIRFKILNKFNFSLNRKYDNALRDIEYDFYFDWSKKLNDSNLFDQAFEKINLALSVKNINEALTLRDKIQNNKNKADVMVSMSSWISKIDVWIEQKEIALAYKKIISIEKLTIAKKDIGALGIRKAEVIALVPDVYNDAITDFVNGDYSSAVIGFQNVLAVSPDYKDALNYLKKANSELKILNLY